jgi:hypothetical protein
MLLLLLLSLRFLPGDSGDGPDETKESTRRFANSSVAVRAEEAKRGAAEGGGRRSGGGLLQVVALVVVVVVVVVVIGVIGL